MKKDFFIIKLFWVDLLSLGGLILSLCSVVFILSNKLSFAMSFLFLAMLADAFDGYLVRRFGKERDFGRYLDGFIDSIDYLIVPSLFFYIWGFNTWYYTLILALFITCGMIRLSVFNSIGNIKDKENKLSYIGMPVFWSVLFLGIIYLISWFIAKKYIFPIVAVLFTVYSILMIYSGRFYKFKSWKVMLFALVGFALIFALDGFGLLQFLHTQVV